VVSINKENHEASAIDKAWKETGNNENSFHAFVVRLLGGLVLEEKRGVCLSILRNKILSLQTVHWPRSG